MAGVNKVILVGNLGKDPELKYLEGNIARANFSIATSEYHKDKNGNKVEQTEWHNIVVWRSMAESAEKLLKKGTQIYLEGKLQTRQWIDKDGNKKESMKKAANDKVTDKSTGKKYAKTKAFGNQKKKTPHKMKTRVLPRKQKHKKAGEKE
jgi:single-strand DNA-binding protein